MKKVSIVLLILIAFLGPAMWLIPGTLAHYLDVETSGGNLFGAALLDFELTSPGDFAPEVSTATNSQRQLSVVDMESIAFHYVVHGENFTGELCPHLDLQALLKGSVEYAGPLTALQAGVFGFGDPEDWSYTAVLNSSDPALHGTTCEFDSVFSGWQIRFPILFSGFHDVERIRSTITAEAPLCDALSQGYWRNHEGCSQGQGTSNWKAEINALSAQYAGVFSLTTGAEICEALWTPNCPGGNTVESRRCKAKAHTLADELDVVSGRLDTAALLAGADDGSIAFVHLGLSGNSTVGHALAIIEDILLNPFSTIQELNDADYVAERIYAFYEDENLAAPQCIYEWEEVEVQSSESASVLTEPPVVEDEEIQEVPIDEAETTVSQEELEEGDEGKEEQEEPPLLETTANEEGGSEQETEKEEAVSPPAKDVGATNVSKEKGEEVVEEEMPEETPHEEKPFSSDTMASQGEKENSEENTESEEQQELVQEENNETKE